MPCCTLRFTKALQQSWISAIVISLYHLHFSPLPAINFLCATTSSRIDHCSSFSHSVCSVPGNNAFIWLGWNQFCGSKQGNVSYRQLCYSANRLRAILGKAAPVFLAAGNLHEDFWRQWICLAATQCSLRYAHVNPSLPLGQETGKRAIWLDVDPDLCWVVAAAVLFQIRHYWSVV